MKAPVNPVRLAQSPEFGDLLRAAAPAGLTPARLARVEASLRKRIASEEDGHQTVGRSKGRARGTRPFGLIVFASTAMSAVGLVLASQMSHSGGSSKPSASFTSLQPTLAEGEAPAAPEAALTPPMAMAPPARVRRVEPAGTAPPASFLSELAPPPEQSTLPDQIQLLRAARSAAQAGDYDAALARLDELLERHPETSLRVEAKLARADYLTRSGRDADAALLIEELLAESSLSAERTALMRLLGDIRLRQGNCPAAVPLYQQALGLGLEDDDAEAVVTALRRCAREKFENR